MGQKIVNALVTMVKNINWRELISSLANALISAIKAALQLVTGTGLLSNAMNVNLLGEPTAPAYSGSSTTQSPVGGGAASAVIVSAGTGGRMTPDLFANGGFPTQGTMFVAGENGAELVGQIGGRTGVMNTDQMAQSLALANEGVIEAVAAMGNAVVNAINRKQTGISVNDVRVALANTNMRYGV